MDLTRLESHERKTPYSLSISVILTLAAASWAVSASAQQRIAPGTAAQQVNLEEIKAQLTVLEQDSSLEMGLRTRLVEYYKQALDDFGRAEEWTQKAIGFEKAKQEAPARLDIRNVAVRTVK